MSIGVYITIVVGAFLGFGFNHFYGHKHKHFGNAIALYTLGSIFEGYFLRLNVDSQLEFKFEAMIVAEAASFTINTFTQAGLIRIINLDPILSFGIANFFSFFMQAVVFWIATRKQTSYTSSLILTKIDQERYLLPNSLKFAFSLAYNALMNDFFDQTYFVIFASGANYLGNLNLIRGFGSLFIRFLYVPINNVTYNLYAQLWTDALKSKEDDKLAAAQASVSKMLAVAKMVVFVYSRLTYFMLVYGVFTADVFLSILFGHVWVTEVRKS